MKTGIIPERDNPVIEAALRLMEQVASQLRPDVEACAYIAGGVAVSWWLGKSRVTFDLDAVYSGRFGVYDISPVEICGHSGRMELDTNYNDSFSFVQEDYYDRAEEIAVIGRMHVKVVAPVDLALMKISRFSQKDREDITDLIKAGLVDESEFERLAADARITYIGNLEQIEYGLEFARQKFMELDECSFRQG